MRICPKCNSQVDDNTVFCTSCGAQMSPNPQPMNNQAGGYVQQQQPFAPSNQPYAQYAAPSGPMQPSAFALYFKRMWLLIKGLLKMPVTIGSQFVHAADYRLSFGLIGIQTLANVFFALAMVLKVNGVLSHFPSNVFYNSIVNEVKLPTLSIFFIVLIVSFGIACLFPAILLMFTKILKSNTTYSHMLCVSGINSIMTSPFILLGTLISLILPITIRIPTSAADATSIVTGILLAIILPVIVATAGSILGFFTSNKLLRSGSTLTQDKSVYIMFFTTLVLAIVGVIIFKIVFPLCMPELLKTGLSAIGISL